MTRSALSPTWATPHPASCLQAGGSSPTASKRSLAKSSRCHTVMSREILKTNRINRNWPCRFFFWSSLLIYLLVTWFYDIYSFCFLGSYCLLPFETVTISWFLTVFGEILPRKGSIAERRRTILCILAASECVVVRTSRTGSRIPSLVFVHYEMIQADLILNSPIPPTQHTIC